MFLHNETLDWIRQTHVPDPQDVVDTKGAARVLGVSESWLNKLRVLDPGQSPRFIRAGRRVLYKLGDLYDWQARRMRGGRDEA